MRQSKLGIHDVERASRKCKRSVGRSMRTQNAIGEWVVDPIVERQPALVRGVNQRCVAAETGGLQVVDVRIHGKAAPSTTQHRLWLDGVGEAKPWLQSAVIGAH